MRRVVKRRQNLLNSKSCIYFETESYDHHQGGICGTTNKAFFYQKILWLLVCFAKERRDNEEIRMKKNHQLLLTNWSLRLYCQPSPNRVWSFRRCLYSKDANFRNPSYRMKV